MAVFQFKYGHEKILTSKFKIIIRVGGLNMNNSA